MRDIVSSVALTFFAFLGFGVITFTAKDLANPSRQLPRAMYLALGIATVVYVAISLGVFGTLTVDEGDRVGSDGDRGRRRSRCSASAGYWLMSVTALFATTGATNAGLYPAPGLSEHLASTGQFPPLMGGKVGGRAPNGLLVASVAILVMVLGFDLSAIASIGSAVALMIFALGDRSPTSASTAQTGARPLRAGPRPAGDRGHAADVHLHDAHPRARVDRDAARDPGGERRPGPRMVQETW